MSFDQYSLKIAKHMSVFFFLLQTCNNNIYFIAERDIQAAINSYLARSRKQRLN